MALASCFISPLPAAPMVLASGPVLQPTLILILCALAGVATVFMLPGHREVILRKLAGVLLAAVGLIFVVSLPSFEEHSDRIYFWIFSAIALTSAVRVITHPRPVYSALYFVMTIFASAGLFVLLEAEFMAAALVIIYAGAILVTYVFVIMLASQATGSGTHHRAMADYDSHSREPAAAAAIGFALMGVLLFLIFDKGENLSPPTGRVLLHHEDVVAGDLTKDGRVHLMAVNQWQSQIDVLDNELRRDQTAHDLMATRLKELNLYGESSSEIRNILEKQLASYDAHSAEVTSSIAALEARESKAMSAAGDRSFQGDIIETGGQTQELGMFLFRNQSVQLELAGLILLVSMVGAIIIAKRKVHLTHDSLQKIEKQEVLDGPATPVDDNPHSVPVYGSEGRRQNAYGTTGYHPV